MAWKIEFSKKADQTLNKLDQETRKRIIRFVQERIAPSGNPRSFGAALEGDRFKRFWKYRVGDYRLVCDIQDQIVTILIVKIGNRKDVYKDNS